MGFYCISKVIQSSMFSFDESSIWDPKIIRKHLCIPEDQLKILSNLPGWSKVTNVNTFRLEKDIIGNSQSSQLSFLTTQNCEKSKQNLQLFEKYFQHNEGVLKRHEECSKKFGRSISVYEINKTNDNTSVSKSLIRTLSLPVLNLSYDNFCLKALQQNSDSKIASPENNLHCASKELVFVQNSSVASQQHSNILKSTSPLKDTSKVAMEIASQIPVNILSHVEQVVNSNSEAAVSGKSDMVSVIYKENSSILSNQQLVTANGIASVNGNAITTCDNEYKDKHDLESSNNKLNSSMKETIPKDANFGIVNEKVVMNLNSEKLVEVSEKPSNATYDDKCKDKHDLESSKDKLDSSMKETIPKDTNFSNATKTVVIDFNSEKLVEVSEKPSKNVEVLRPALKEKLEINDSSHQNLTQGQVGVTAAVEPVAEVQGTPKKHKLDSKMKSSKKRKHTREKSECTSARSVKRAGEISFTEDDINSMINIMKCYL